jgi:Xaa-Pro aminopeptidase
LARWTGSGAARGPRERGSRGKGSLACPNDGPCLHRRPGGQALRGLLAHADLSALLVTRPANVRYLTGFTGTYGALLLLHDRTLFFTDGRYRHQAAAEVPGAEVVLAPGDLIGAVGGVVRPAATASGFEPAGLTWGEGQRLRSGLPGQAVMPAPPLVEELREVKDERELTAMREAARLGGEALEGCCRPCARA